MTLVITISGLHGTGKSTYAQILSEIFALRRFSAGELFRQIANEKDISVSKLSEMTFNNKEIDKLIDNKTKEEAKRGGVILEGLLTGWIAKDQADIKLFLTTSERIRLRRISKREGVNYDIARKKTMHREMLERRRFKLFYGININDLSIYDLTLNTGLLSTKSNIKIIDKFIREYIRTYRTK